MTATPTRALDPTDPAELLRGIRVLPVLTMADTERAVGTARALAAGGLRVIELTLRTEAALETIAAIVAEVPDVVVGAGTVRSAADLDGAARAGARFAVSPGHAPALLAAARASELPFVPGVATASEAMAAAEAGFTTLKLFPAETCGGLDLLRALAAPLPDLRFCPTGGIRADTFRAYLALPNVICVGGSWLTPPELVDAGHWDTITRRAKEVTA